MIIYGEPKEQAGASKATMEELDYWERRGARTAAFLLVIPGCALIGVGAGLHTGQLLADAIIGFGAGLLIWGLIVAR